MDAGLSVVFLCYNDSMTIEKCIVDCLSALTPLTSSLQIIVVEDGSTDCSASVLRSLKRSYPLIDIIWHESNQGYGKSLNDGIAHARNDFILFSDGDGQFDIRDSYNLIERMAPDIDVVSGCRLKRADEFHRMMCGALFNLIARLLLAPELADVDCGFKLFRTSSVRQAVPVNSRMAAWVEIMAVFHKLGFRCDSVPVRHLPRQSGKSTAFTIPNIKLMGYELIRLLTLRIAPQLVYGRWSI